MQSFFRIIVVYICIVATSVIPLLLPSQVYRFSIEVNGIFAHFSFLDSLSERRMECILPLSRELLSKLEGHKSPVVADVKSSVVFEVCFCLCCFYFFRNLIQEPKGLKFVGNIGVSFVVRPYHTFARHHTL